MYKRIRVTGIASSISLSKMSKSVDFVGWSCQIVNWRPCIKWLNIVDFGPKSLFTSAAQSKPDLSLYCSILICADCDVLHIFWAFVGHRLEVTPSTIRSLFIEGECGSAANRLGCFNLNGKISLRTVSGSVSASLCSLASDVTRSF